MQWIAGFVLLTLIHCVTSKKRQTLGLITTPLNCLVKELNTLGVG